MNLIITIVIISLVTYLFTLLAKKIKVPAVVAMIVGGLIMSFPLIKKIIIEPNTQFIFALGDIALICLMFLAGLESSWRVLYSERKDALFIAVFAAIVPFLLGTAIFVAMGFSLLVSSIVGICMSITAEATKARVLLSLNKIRTRVGSAMMGAGVMDDILGLSLFVLVTYLLKAINLKDDLLIVGAIISFFVGIIIQRKIGRRNLAVKFTEKLLLLVVVPFFFVSIGLHFNFNSLFIDPFLLIIMIAIAISGKIAGTLLTKPFTKLSWKQLHLIGWAMNSRGAIELAIALVAFRTSLISIKLYSGLVVTALITTLIFPFIIEGMVKKEPKLMK